MFSKNNTYLFPHDHDHHPRSSAVDLNAAELFINHHHHHHPDIFSFHHYNNNNNVPAANITDHHHQAATDLLLNYEAHGVTQRKAQQTSKKDRHSKIFTSQGPRDRRVRLSIGIARKFFDLQEMLGFDKPSKTLDWLLTKSKAAIKELVVHTKTNKSSSECDDELIIPSDQPLEYGEDHTSKGKSGNKNIKGGASSSTSLAKESRAKARARARERTREKMCIKQLKNGGENDPCLDSSNPIFNVINGPTSQYTNKNNSIGLFPLSAAGTSSRETFFQESAANNNHLHLQDIIQEPVLIKRKTKNNVQVPSFFGFQQNVFVSRDSSSSYGGVPFATINGAHENWDITSQSNICTILDQHKFMNSSSNNM